VKGLDFTAARGVSGEAAGDAARPAGKDAAARGRIRLIHRHTAMDGKGVRFKRVK
jgi:hypothetical protein